MAKNSSTISPQRHAPSLKSPFSLSQLSTTATGHATKPTPSLFLTFIFHLSPKMTDYKYKQGTVHFPIAPLLLPGLDEKHSHRETFFTFTLTTNIFQHSNDAWWENDNPSE